MKTETNLDAIKETSKLLFNAVPIEESEFSIVIHPYVNSLYNFNPETRKLTIYGSGAMTDYDIGEAPWFPYKEKLFEFLDAGDIYRILGMVNSGWKMTWFKYCSQFMNQKDFGELLAYCWVQQENPNQDANVSRQEAVEYFREAKKRYLMEPEDYKVYKSLPDVVTVYRGVAKGRERYGLSWTANRDKAEWFQTRFKGDNYLLKADVPKQSILAYFNTRDEDELVVDVFSIMDKIKEVK